MSTPRLFTSRWQHKWLADLDVIPVGISRGTPRFPVPYRYRLVRELAPEREMFGLDERDFTAAYTAMLDRIGLDAIMEKLAKISAEHGNRPLALLCYEPADQFCHRHVLRDWLHEHGIEIKELEPGDVERRPDAPQQSLF